MSQLEQKYIYDINYFSGFIASGAVYWILASLFPIPATSDKWNEIPYEPHQMSDAEEKKWKMCEAGL